MGDNLMGDIGDSLAGLVPYWILINMMVDIIGGVMVDKIMGDISDGLAGLAPRWISAYRLSPVLMGFHLVGNF